MAYIIQIENKMQVVADTLWTEAEAPTAMTREKQDSTENLILLNDSTKWESMGLNLQSFVWKPFPKTVRSKFPIAVSRNTNMIEPRKPPRIVNAGEDA